jgi:hypothetical protein
MAPATLRELREAALAAERGDKLRHALQRLGLDESSTAAVRERPAVAVGEAA